MVGCLSGKVVSLTLDHCDGESRGAASQSQTLEGFGYDRFIQAVQGLGTVLDACRLTRACAEDRKLGGNSGRSRGTHNTGGAGGLRKFRAALAAPDRHVQRANK